MQREVRAYVLDIVETCDAIALDVHDIELDTYRTNRQVRSAVEREFITIGEAVGVLRQLAPDVFARRPALGRPAMTAGALSSACR